MNQNNEALVQRIDNARRYIWGTVPTEESIDSLLLDLREAIASAGVVAEPVGVFHSIPRHTPYGVSWFIESALPEGTKLYTTPPAPAASPVVPEGYALVPIVASTAVLDRAVSFALNVSLSREYTWSDYMRDLWAQMIADHIPGATKMVVSQAAPAPAVAPVVAESRPSNCRNRLRDEGKAYPRSGCGSCQAGGMTGCPHEMFNRQFPSADLSGGDQK